MDQEKIGKFIAKHRKEKKMTQQELAAKLGVTDKSISNWENGRNMPDLSLFNPLCEILGISINELISGDEIDTSNYQEKLEENLLNTIFYTNKKIKEKNNLISIITIIFGLLIIIISFTLFASESSFGSIYSIIGLIISLVGISKFTKKFGYFKRLTIKIGYFIIVFMSLLLIDYLSVINLHQAPRFSYIKESGENLIVYKTLFYNVYRVNRNTINEYYIVDTFKKYNEDMIPISPFNRDKSGIDNIIKYKNKYIGNNSNIGNLISNLPLSEYGYVFEIDSVNLSLTINYQVTDWYINENKYLEKSLLYNAVTMFILIDNLEEITFNFSGNSFVITRNEVKDKYPNYCDILDKEIDKNNFNKYVEDKMNDDEFVTNIFIKMFD